MHAIKEDLDGLWQDVNMDGYDLNQKNFKGLSALALAVVNKKIKAIK